VAERAGVRRATLYRHFPDEEALFDACSSHWMAQHPLPDPASWSAIEAPEERLQMALHELYGWYARGANMLEKTTRDAALVPALDRPMAAFAGWLEAAAGTLARGRRERGARRRRVQAAIGHALAFETWRSLVGEQGLSEDEAIELMAHLVANAANP
jgi:AcrR family transcriptional regulator